jgi:ATP-dependent DNA helicase RecQ
LAARWPQDEDAFSRVFGVGRQKLENYGEAFLAEIRAYCLENPSVQETAPARRPTSSSLKGLQRTAHIQERFAAGLTLAELSEELGFTTQTILKHLSRAHQTGLPVEPAVLIASSGLDEMEQERVRAAFAEHGTQYLKPVFEALEETVSYDELHLWRLIYDISGK